MPSVAVSEALYDPSRNEPPAVNEKVERTVLRTGAKFMNPRWAFVNNGAIREALSRMPTELFTRSGPTIALAKLNSGLAS